MYVKATMNQGFFFSNNSQDTIVGYVDVDWGIDLNNRKPTT